MTTKRETSPYLNTPLRSEDRVLHTRRRAVEMTRERGWEWDELTPLQQDRMMAHAEQETRGGEG